MRRGDNQPRILRPADRMGRSAILVFLGVIIAGCASVDRFTVKPRNICRGDTVTASWSVQGDARLESEPSLPGTGPQPDTGKQRFTVNGDTRFTLVASALFGKDAEVVDVMVAPPGRTYGSYAQCSVNQRLISAQIQLDNQLSRRFRIGSIRNPLDRPLRISKGPRTALIEPHAEDTTFRGMPVTGVWRLASPLKSGETCESAMLELRQWLQMHINLQCGD